MREKRICDLGCGTGILAIGAALLGAETVRAVDCDPPQSAPHGRMPACSSADVEFIVADIAGADANGLAERIGPCDTVVMNPPFGAQKERACRPAVYRLLPLPSHRSRTASSMPAPPLLWRAYIKGRGTIDGRISGSFPIKRSFAFHTKDVQEIDVEILRLSPDRICIIPGQIQENPV